MTRLARSRTLNVLGWGIATFFMVFGGGMLPQHPVIGWISIVFGSIFIQINGYYERKISYAEGRIEGYRTLLTEVVERKRDVEQRS